MHASVLRILTLSPRKLNEEDAIPVQGWLWKYASEANIGGLLQATDDLLARNEKYYLMHSTYEGAAERWDALRDEAIIRRRMIFTDENSQRHWICTTVIVIAYFMSKFQQGDYSEAKDVFASILECSARGFADNTQDWFSEALALAQYFLHATTPIPRWTPGPGQEMYYNALVEQLRQDPKVVPFPRALRDID